MPKLTLYISDTAVLRYLETRYSFDIRQIREDMLSDRVRNAVPVLGDGKYPIRNVKRAKAVIRNGVVKTVIRQ